MTTTKSPLSDLNRAHQLLETCNKEGQLEAAFNYFELVMQKWERLLSTECSVAFRREFLERLRNKKRDLHLE